MSVSSLADPEWGWGWTPLENPPKNIDCFFNNTGPDSLENKKKTVNRLLGHCNATPQLVPIHISFTRDRDIAYHVGIQWPIGCIIPSQHSLSGYYHRPARVTPFKWLMAGGPLKVNFYCYMDPLSSPHQLKRKKRFFVFSYDGSSS